MNGETPQAPDGGNWQFKPDSDTPKTDIQQQPPTADFSKGAEAVAPATEVAAPVAPAVPQPEVLRGPEVTWSASEFIAHEKSPLWYVALGACTFLVVAIVYLLTKDVVAVIALAFVAMLFGVLGAHKPRVLNYHVDTGGLTIDKKFYPYSEFKSFGVVDEGAFSSIVFMPMRRFMPTLTIYYPPENEDDVVEALSAYLPFAPASHDLIDRMMRRIRL